MATARSADGTELHWTETGEGPAVLLIHGYASSLERNWAGTGWLDALARHGFRAVAYDQRGHGRSTKHYETRAYAPARLVEDLVAVLDATGAERAALFGYSMGARVALEAGLVRPERTAALVLSGMGAAFQDLGGAREEDRDAVPQALLADDPSGFPAWARGYRTFADRGGADRRALAACWDRPRRLVERAELARLAVPVLVAAGDRDAVAGDPRPLAESIPGAELVLLPGRDHMKAVGAREHREAVLAFLGRALGVAPG